MFGWNLMDSLFGNTGQESTSDDLLQPQPEQRPIDINRDYIVDGYVEVTTFDRDRDGVVDGSIATTFLDTNGDGTIDIITYDYDNDGDMVFEAHQRFVDSDGDGQFEHTPSEEDAGLFDVPDSTFENKAGRSPLDGIVTLPRFETSGSLEWPSLGANYNPYHPSSAMIGNPSQDMQHWEYQGDSGPCAIFAQKFAIEELLGRELDTEDMISVASQHGWYDGGTSMGNMGQMLEYYGLHAVPNPQGDMEAISRCLAQGGKVIVAVDGNEIWEGENDPFFFSPNDPNHAVEVIGIDCSNADNPMVILNDSGTPDGRGLMIPLAQFEDAWEDSGNFMVEAYAYQIGEL